LCDTAQDGHVGNRQTKFLAANRDLVRLVHVGTSPNA
jgi:hypothetical protein